MTIKEQLNRLARQFPHSKDLAVSLDMVLDYEMEIVYMKWLQRSNTSHVEWPLDGYDTQPQTLRTLDGATINVTKISLAFKDRRLALVEVV